MIARAPDRSGLAAERQAAVANPSRPTTAIAGPECRGGTIGAHCGSIAGMKLSVSLRGQDVEFLDAYARAHGKASRSAALTDAVRALRDAELGQEYEQAIDEWDEGDDAELWERTSSDGI